MAGLVVTQCRMTVTGGAAALSVHVSYGKRSGNSKESSVPAEAILTTTYFAGEHRGCAALLMEGDKNTQLVDVDQSRFDGIKYDGKISNAPSVPLRTNGDGKKYKVLMSTVFPKKMSDFQVFLAGLTDARVKEIAGPAYSKIGDDSFSCPTPSGDYEKSQCRLHAAFEADRDACLSKIPFDSLSIRLAAFGGAKWSAALKVTLFGYVA